jgi:hypothetical protein
MTIYTNSGMVLAMESARAAAQAITTLTNADPGVVGLVSHGYSDGDILYLEVEGMHELNGRLFEVVNKADDTLQLRNTDTGDVGIDTTDYGVFTSGTMAKVTLGTNIPGAQEFSASGGEPKFVDTTTVSDLQDKQIVVGATAISYTLTMQWDPSDTAQKAMKDAFEIRAEKGFKFTWPNGRYAMWAGTVGYSAAPGGAAQGVTTSPVAIALNGVPTYGID